MDFRKNNNLIKMKKITEKQNLAIRAYLTKNKIKLGTLAEHIGCWQSQLTGYLNGVPVPNDRYNAIQDFCK